MRVSIPGIAINVVMVLVLVILGILALVYRRDLTKCEGEQSPFCYRVTCPCDSTSTGPCFGYTHRSGPTEGTYYCSNAPLVLVDANGNQVA
jgi:hypothetical protein